MLGYKTKLMVIIGVFGLILTFSVSFVDQWRFTKQLKKDYEIQTSLIKDNVVTAISDVDKAHHVLEKRLDEKMLHYSEELLEKYKEEPDFDEWDFDELRNYTQDLDIYIVNADNVITHSSYPVDMGMDFAKTAPDFSDNLHYIRNKGEFIVDGVDAETRTGGIRKYSYMPTPDHKYIIELGYSLKDSKTFELFNFVNVVNDLIAEYTKVDRITLYTADGKSLGSVDENGDVIEVSKGDQDIFDKVKSTKRPVKKIDDWGLIHEYIPYMIEYKDENEHYTDFRFIEITYNQSKLHQSMKSNRQIFMLQLVVILCISIFMAFLITKLISRPMYLASYDLLTGLFNRSAFYTQLQDKLKDIRKSDDPFAVLMLDLDNFKQVNDTLGHDGGDSLLKEVGRRMEMSLRDSKDTVARLGGDEFGVILDHVKSVEDAKEIATRMLLEFHKPLMIQDKDVVEDLNVSASIGIVMVPMYGRDSQTIYKNADLAMYRAKNAGKNRFIVYDPKFNEEEEH